MYLSSAKVCEIFTPRKIVFNTHSYLPPKDLPEFGPLHDGGTAANNPAEHGLWECKIIWRQPYSKAAAVVSIGTGCSHRFNSPRSTDERQLHQGGFIQRILALILDSSLFRVLRAFLSSRQVDAQNSWDALMNHLEDHVRPDYIRMNLFFDDAEPALDDVERMPDLVRQVNEQLKSQNDCPAAARILWAAQFFFELNGEPDYRRGTFRCHGAILCRSLSSYSLVRYLETIFSTAQFMLNDGTVLGHLSTEHCCDNCGFFRIDVAFDIRHRDVSVHIFLVFNKLFRRRINGFPNPIPWFEEQQELNYVFGRTDHRSKLEPRRCSCASVLGKKKRRVHFADESPSKRRAL